MKYFFEILRHKDGRLYIDEMENMAIHGPLAGIHKVRVGFKHTGWVQIIGGKTVANFAIGDIMEVNLPNLDVIDPTKELKARVDFDRLSKLAKLDRLPESVRD